MVKVDNPLPQNVQAQLKYLIWSKGIEYYYYQYVKNDETIRVYNPYRTRLGRRPTKDELLRLQNLREASERWRGLIKCQKRPFYTLAYGLFLAEWLRNPAMRSSGTIEKPYAPYTKGYYMYLYEYTEYKRLTRKPLPDPIPFACAAYYPTRDPAAGCIIIAHSEKKQIPDFIEIIDSNGHALSSATCPHLDPHRLFVIGPYYEAYYPPWKYGLGVQFWGEVKAAQLPNLPPLIVAPDFRVQVLKPEQWFYPQHPNHFNYEKQNLGGGFFKVRYTNDYFDINIENVTTTLPITTKIIEEAVDEFIRRQQQREQKIWEWFNNRKERLEWYYFRKEEFLRKRSIYERARVNKKLREQLRYHFRSCRADFKRKTQVFFQERTRLIRDAEEEKEQIMQELEKNIELLEQEKAERIKILEQQRDLKLSKVCKIEREVLLENAPKIENYGFKLRLTVKRGSWGCGTYVVYWARVALPPLRNEPYQVGEELLVADITYWSYKNFDIKILKYCPPGLEEIPVMLEPWSYDINYPEENESLKIQEPWSS